jgi:hypothetical protein
VPQDFTPCPRGVYTAPFLSLSGQQVLFAIDGEGRMLSVAHIDPAEHRKAAAQLWLLLARADTLTPQAVSA